MAARGGPHAPYPSIMATNPRPPRKRRPGRPGRVWDRIDRTRWQRVRRAALTRDGFRCRRCGRAGRLEADHIRPLTDDPGQDPYALERLQTLCRSCHISKTRTENAARNPVRPEVQAWRDMVRELLEDEDRELRA